MQHQQPRRQRMLVLIVLVVSLLFLLLAHAGSAHNAPVLCFVLVPIFLFGSVVLLPLVWLTSSTTSDHSVPPPARPSLFQRPPPLPFA